jgi:hypothetical protein
MHPSSAARPPLLLRQELFARPKADHCGRSESDPASAGDRHDRGVAKVRLNARTATRPSTIVAAAYDM